MWSIVVSGHEECVAHHMYLQVTGECVRNPYFLAHGYHGMCFVLVVPMTLEAIWKRLIGENTRCTWRLIDPGPFGKSSLCWKLIKILVYMNPGFHTRRIVSPWKIKLAISRIMLKIREYCGPMFKPWLSQYCLWLDYLVSLSKDLWTYLLHCKTRRAKFDHIDGPWMTDFPPALVLS